MEDKADAFITVQGGIGTFEEFFEILTLKQLGRHRKPIAIYNINGYFNDMLKLINTAVEQNFMRDESGKLYSSFKSADDMLDYIESSRECEYNPVKLKFLKSLEEE